MNTFFLDNETMKILGQMVHSTKNIDSEENYETLNKGFKRAGIISVNEDGEEVMDEMASLIIETYLTSRNRVILRYEKTDRIISRAYYFLDDVIVMLTAYRDGGEFVWLPSAMHLAGSIAELIENQKIVSVNKKIEEIKCDKEINEINYETELSQYKPRSEGEANTLWIKCVGENKEVSNFVNVVFTNNSAYLYNCEKGKITYSLADRITVVNTLGKWMIDTHRNLIMNAMTA